MIESFLKLLCLLNVLKVLYCVRVNTLIVKSTFVEARLCRRIQRVPSGWVLWLLELIDFLIDKTVVFRLGLHELAHERGHLASWDTSNLVGSLFLFIDLFLYFLLREGSLLLENLVLFLLLFGDILCFKLAHQLTHKISCSLWRLLDLLFSLFNFLATIILVS